MAFEFNPLTGEFDIVGSSGSGAQAPNYLQTFVSGDWVGPVDGFYSLTILASIHNKGINPVIQVFELNGTDYEEIDLSITVHSITGDITLGVTETPDSRFNGKIIISENN